MNPQESVTIRLAQAELVFLLLNVNTQTLPGLGAQPLGAIDAETQQQLLAAARESLLARDFLMVDEQGELKVDVTVQSVVSACAFPDQVVAILFDHHDQPGQRRYYYRVPEFIVIHTLLPEGIHELELTLSSDMGREQLGEVFRLIPPGTARTETYLISQNALAEAQRLSESGSASGAAVLEAVVMPPPDAQLLAGAFRAPVVRMILHCIYQLGDHPQQRVLTVVADEQSCWLMNADAVDVEYLTVQARPVSEIQAIVYAVHSPLLASVATSPVQ